MSQPIIVVNISPERLAKWKRRYPIHWRWILDMLEADEIIQRGGAHPRFTLLACYRTWELMLSMYDLACPTERDRQDWRRRFRLLLAEHPILEKVFPAFRWRLNEHDNWVKYGMDELDPDEIEGGCDGTV
jgi:hypothetical protein